MPVWAWVWVRSLPLFVLLGLVGLFGLLGSGPVWAGRLVPTDACVQVGLDATCRPIALALPFHWDASVGQRSGSARFGFRLERDEADGPAPTLLLPRAGNGFSVELDGALLAAVGTGAQTPFHDTTKRPWLIPLPAERLSPEGNRLVITVMASGGRAAQLQPPRVGAFAAVQADWEDLRIWRVETPRTLMWIAALIAAICMLMGLVQRDLLFLACGLAQVGWALRLLELGWVRTPLPWPEWGGIVATMLMGTQVALTVYFLQAAGLWSERWRRAGMVFTAVWLLVGPFVVASGVDGLWLAWLGLASAALLAVNLHVAREAFRRRLFWRWLFIAWWVGLMGAVASDIAESPGSFYVHPTASRLVVGLFSLVLVALVARRLREANLSDRARSRELRRALNEQQQRLKLLHEAEARRVVERATWTERQRLMRDMHDGLGAQLYGLHALAGRPEAARRELQGQIRQAIEELRLVVDAMNPFDGDLAAMLGDLRSPLERRLALSQVDLRWAVEELPRMDVLSPAQVQHLKRLLLEAATNIARHSGATEARLSAHSTPDGLTLELSDNGQGFDPNAPRAGNGLRNMRWRAMMLGAQIDIEAQPHCRIRLRLPLDPAAAPAPGPVPPASPASPDEPGAQPLPGPPRQPA